MSVNVIKNKQIGQSAAKLLNWGRFNDQSVSSYLASYWQGKRGTFLKNEMKIWSKLYRNIQQVFHKGRFGGYCMDSVGTIFIVKLLPGKIVAHLIECN